ncbi:MAG: helix-turn-helix domain-containing protein [Pirellulales bacterium]
MATATAEKKTRRKRKFNKSAAIREYLESHPETSPKEIADALKAKHKVNVSAQLVSNIKHNMNAKPGKRGPKAGKRRGRKPGSVGAEKFSMQDLLAAKHLVAQLGSVEAATSALKALAALNN